MLRILKKLLKWLVELAIIVFICILMLDGIIYFILSNPQALPDNPLTRLVRLVNISAARAQPAYDPACAEYDEQVSYRYKPGQCRHRSWEFDVTIKANSEGFPDDEISLAKPEIIVLGDSYAAGWGVEQDEAFPALLENMLGKRVLVAAAPSYATGRELLLLDRMDLSNVNTVVIQYSSNDAFENLAVYRDGEVKPMRITAYGTINKSNLKRNAYMEKRYSPGKYIRLVQFTLSQPKQPSLPKNEVLVKHLLGIIDSSRLAKMDGVRIIIISINQESESDTNFHSVLENRLSQVNAPEHYSRITAIKTREDLTKDDYYILDDHLRSSGHQKVAELLYQVLRRY